MKKIALIIIFILSICNCLAYPITPRPLRQLIIESQYIISGKVISVTELELDPNYYTAKAQAKIEITQVFKGNLQKQFMEIQFDNYIGCPQPAHYKPNTLVIAFLDFEKDKFFTHALSYGSKTLEANDIEVYKERILEMQRILEIKDQLKQYEETLDWLITCVENPATQWEGVFELSPQSNFMSFYSQGKQIDFGQFLSKNQKERLLKILKKKDFFNYGDFGIIDLVYTGNEQFIDNRLIESLSKLDEFELLFTNEYMQRLKHLIAPKLFEKYLEKAEKYSIEFGKEKKQKKNIANFIASIRK